MTTKYQALQERIARLQSQADRIRERSKAEMVAKITTLMRDYDITVSDLGTAPPAAPVRFRDENGNTWVGRGPRPAWVADALDRGHQLQDFAVS